METIWPRMPWDALNEISYNNIHVTIWNPEKVEACLVVRGARIL